MVTNSNLKPHPIIPRPKQATIINLIIHPHLLIKVGVALTHTRVVVTMATLHLHKVLLDMGNKAVTHPQLHP